MAWEVFEADLTLKYVIDRRPKRYRLFDSYTPNDVLQSVDVIVITCQDCENVRRMLSEKITTRIIYISELLERTEVNYASN